MTFSLIDPHVLPGTAWMADFGGFADAVLLSSPGIGAVRVSWSAPTPTGDKQIVPVNGLVSWR
jgi:hypothetical protein